MNVHQFKTLFPHASDSMLRANFALSAPSPAPLPEGRKSQPIATPMKNRIRQNSAGLNQTETAFRAYLQDAGSGVIFEQAITLKLGNGVRYTPDFFTAADATNEHENRVTECHAYEVKGFMRDDAAVKLKVAASLYPWIKFHLVTKKPKRDGGGWDIQEVLA